MKAVALWINRDTNYLKLGRVYEVDVEIPETLGKIMNEFNEPTTILLHGRTCSHISAQWLLLD